MYTLLKPIQVREQLISKNIRFFTPKLFSKIFNSSQLSTKHFIETQTKSGLLLTRLKKGLYTLKTDPPSEEEIANTLYQPSYISFEYALAYYGLLPEMPYTITSATTKPTRNFTLNSLSFLYRSIKNNIYFGYSLIKQNDKSFSIADPEKAFLDYFYFVFLGKSTTNDRLITSAKSKINPITVKNYLKLFHNSSFTKFIKSIL
ncbi:hypothetical protein COX08_03075 [Candidatus Beckwithbacteria bacterium CG23_combo_of_CG06-09_8_20_14_all_34_8]|uniref:Uncharacterized protein n=1 Tax=Candidatus Beckwithbacteria bacterium CG23_combo_of_CG06-09_8_20_14_all_34_8 TaxID=1974497 RepID=A0A2H0B5X1_9BACT|nr:MAG: hypothetical protein COX08_03075 [Candidatus Beckwithbacteria bacterium CG23_combo_of_CG06-09_8_20_14_all_34_8]